MKTKKVIFTFTGETRQPQPDKGEFFKTPRFAFIECISTCDPVSEIYTMQEREEEWTPRDEEGYCFPDINFKDLYGNSTFHSDNIHDQHRKEQGLCYPFTKQGKEAAIEKSKQILEFLKTNK